MKNAHKVRLSLRKLLIAMLAVGPLAVLPSPVWATLPTASSFAVTNGTATVTSAGSIANINTSDKAVLVWGFANATTSTQTLGTFTIGSGETYNFNLPSNGAVLNKVGYAPSSSQTAAADNATINGSLLSNGKVFILANGNISVGSSAVINTAGGLVLSTLAETSDSNFIANGDLTYAGNATGSIALNTLNVGGNLSAYSGAFATGTYGAASAGAAVPTIGGGIITAIAAPVSPGAYYSTPPTVTITDSGGGTGASATAVLNSSGQVTGFTNLVGGTGYTAATTVTFAANAQATQTTGQIAGGSVSGDLLLKAITSASGIDLAKTGGLTVGGNLLVTTKDGALAGTNALTVGNSTSLNAGAASITLANNSNDFKSVSANTTGATNGVTLRDANIVTLGTSTIGGDLSVTVGGDVNTTGIATSGAVAVGGNASLMSASSINSSISFQNGSSVGGVISAVSAGGQITINTTGNLTVGNVTNNATATTLAGGAYAPLAGTSVVSSGAVTGVTLTAGTASPVYTGNQSVTFSSPVATATATLGLSTTTPVTVTNSGSGYAAAPAVTFTAPPAGGTAPTGTATINAQGQVTGITITAPGSGYTSVPAITIAAPGGTGTATAAATGVGQLATVVVSTGGSNYTGATDTITISGGGGSGATATATLGGLGDTIASATVGAAGTGFTSLPLVTINPPVVGAVPAQGNAVFVPVSGTTNGFVTSVAITNAGVGYGLTLPTVGFPAVSYNVGNVSITTSGALTTTAGAVGLAANLGGAALTPGIVSGNTTSLTAASITMGAQIKDAGTKTTAALKSTAGDIVLNTIADSAVSVTAVGGNISQVATKVITTSNATNASTFSAVGNNVTLDQANVFKDNQPINITGNNVVLNVSGNAVTVANANVTSNATITASSGKNITLGNGTAVGAGGNITVGNVLTVTSGGSGTITDNAFTSFNVFGSENFTTGTGNISLTAATANAGFAPRVSLGQFNAATTGNITIAETTGLNLGNISSLASPAATLTATSVTGPIIATGNIYVAGLATFTVGSGQSVTLNNTTTTTQLGSIAVVGGVDNVISGLSSNVAIGSGTAVSGNLTVGTTSGNNIVVSGGTVTGNVTLNSGGGIDINGPTTVNGNLTLNATGNFAGTAFNTFLAPTVSVNNTSGLVTGVSTSNNTMVSFSTAPTVTINPGTSGGTLATAAAVLNPNGTIASFNVTANGTGYTTATTTAPSVTLSGGTTNTSITEEPTGSLTVTGTTSVSASGNAFLWRGNDFNNVILSSSKDVTVNDVNNLSVTGTAGGNVIATAGGGSTVTGGPLQIAQPWALSLGTLSVGSLVATSGNGGNGNSGTLTQQSGTTIHSENLASFVSTNNTITIANNGNSFGRVQLNTGGAGATIVEDGTLKLGNVTGAKGNVTLTSRFGDIIEDPTADVNVTNNGTLSVNAPNGSIKLGDLTHTAGATTGNVVTYVASAPNGSVALKTTTGNLALGNITALALTVNATGGNLTQSGAAKIYGASTFSSSKNITLSNTSNNFGRISVTETSADQNISITEAGTLNLGTVSMPASSTGNFSATSVAGDIIDTGLAGVKLGGTVAAPGSGVVTLVAAAGNIVIDDPTTDFPTTSGVVFNANNVTLSPLGSSTLVLGAANQTATAGNLTVTSAIGAIANAGAVNVSGDAFFQTGNKDITITQTTNKFGTVKFTGANVRITSGGDLALVTGSSATGVAEFGALGGNITIVNRGGIVTLGSTGNFTASGNITLPKLIQAVGTVTVSAPGTKDLSALSVSSDLSGISPNNQGAGAYLPPQP